MARIPGTVSEWEVRIWFPDAPSKNRHVTATCESEALARIVVSAMAGYGLQMSIPVMTTVIRTDSSMEIVSVEDYRADGTREL